MEQEQWLALVKDYRMTGLMLQTIELQKARIQKGCCGIPTAKDLVEAGIAVNESWGLKILSALDDERQRL